MLITANKLFNSNIQDVFSSSLSEPDSHYLSLYASYVLEIQEESNKRKKNDEEYEKEKEKLVRECDMGWRFFGPCSSLNLSTEIQMN